jgi:hypothetical protein
VVTLPHIYQEHLYDILLITDMLGKHLVIELWMTWCNLSYPCPYSRSCKPVLHKGNIFYAPWVHSTLLNHASILSIWTTWNLGSPSWFVSKSKTRFKTSLIIDASLMKKHAHALCPK